MQSDKSSEKGHDTPAFASTAAPSVEGGTSAIPERSSIVRSVFAQAILYAGDDGVSQAHLCYLDDGWVEYVTPETLGALETLYDAVQEHFASPRIRYDYSTTPEKIRQALLAVDRAKAYS